MIRSVMAVLLLISLIPGCGKKHNEKDLQDMQQTADSLDRHRRLEERLRMIDSLALILDSAKIK